MKRILHPVAWMANNKLYNEHYTVVPKTQI
jgi:hypothetical protein